MIRVSTAAAMLPNAEELLNSNASNKCRARARDTPMRCVQSASSNATLS